MKYCDAFISRRINLAGYVAHIGQR